ncbi:EF-hand domain-containing protein [Extensimonas vulgaris]|uniref:EF hand domain-containing protein n=1 Tax=Extensimonas vulgaris TaxID=1031594 RepID=A0A369AK97_9BURK|nr:EF-hand domain-containing protein [Extensimonas vulgaris]RCX09485.1 EF hand domain-containing protein [Extensimonas vulgaris]TWI38615.1 EF hand domain-containing protein [Extensimonas vulgaris]TXD14531.1 EF-hand domain-containing protein [Extensimonas vulgaris]
MKAQQRCLFPFETRSVMLFAALTLGGLGAAQAQGNAPAPQWGPAGSSEKSAPRSNAQGAKPEGNQTGAPKEGQASNQADAVEEAFERADANRDGQLSPQEAATLPAIGQRFQALDTDHNGMLSRAEFARGAQP